MKKIKFCLFLESLLSSNEISCYLFKNIDVFQTSPLRLAVKNHLLRTTRLLLDYATKNNLKDIDELGVAYYIMNTKHEYQGQSDTSIKNIFILLLTFGVDFPAEHVLYNENPQDLLFYSLFQWHLEENTEKINTVLKRSWFTPKLAKETLEYMHTEEAKQDMTEMFSSYHSMDVRNKTSTLQKMSLDRIIDQINKAGHTTFSSIISNKESITKLHIPEKLFLNTLSAKKLCESIKERLLHPNTDVIEAVVGNIAELEMQM